MNVPLNRSCISAAEVTFGATPLPPLTAITDIHIDFVELYSYDDSH